MTWASLQRSTRLPDRIERSEVESDRFGLDIGRLELGVIEDERPEDVVDLVAASGLELVILRFPTGHGDWFSRLLNPDMDVLYAGTIVYYCKLLTDAEVSPLAITAAGPDDLALVEELVVDAFAGYDNHYAANPLLDQEAALAGYVEWATTFVHDEGKMLMILRDADNATPMAWAGLRLERPGEIVIGGVSSGARGRGVYKCILGAAEGTFLGLGLSESWISSQVNNIPVIRSWGTAGYRYMASFSTVHLVVGPGRLRRSPFIARRPRDSDHARWSP